MKNLLPIILVFLSVKCFGGSELGINLNMISYTNTEVSQFYYGVSFTGKLLYTNDLLEVGPYINVGKIKQFSGPFFDFGGLANIKFAKQKASNFYVGVAAGYLTSGAEPISGRGFIFGGQAGIRMGINALRINLEIAPRFMQADTKLAYSYPGSLVPKYADYQAPLLFIPFSAGIRVQL